MKCNMTDEQIKSVISNAPEGSQYYTDGYDVKYRKVIGGKYFGYLDEAKGWVETCDKELSQERIDKGWWIKNLLTALERRTPQIKEVEWDGEYQLEGGSGWFKYKSTYTSSSGDMFAMCLVPNANKGKPFEQYLDLATTKFRTLETEAERVEREGINNIAAHLWGRRLSLEVNELARLLHGLGYRKPDTERESD